MRAIGFTQQSLDTVAFHRLFEITLGNSESNPHRIFLICAAHHPCKTKRVTEKRLTVLRKVLENFEAAQSLVFMKGIRHLNSAQYAVRSAQYRESAAHCVLITAQDYFLLACLMYSSSAIVIDGVPGFGAWMSRRNPASSTAFAVAGPKAAIRVLFCLNFGKFL